MRLSERDELEFLSRARRGLLPSDRDGERVLAALSGIVALPASTLARAAPEPSLDLHTIGKSLARGWLARVAIGAAIAAAGGAGYHFGYAAGRADDDKRQTRVAPTTAASIPNPGPSRAISAKTGETAATTQTSTQHRTTVRPAVSALPGLDPDLAEEARSVARIERSLRDENPRLALGLLDELDRALPSGQLKEERQAARVIAHCQLGGETASTFAARFGKQNPNSAYLSRIREICGPTPSDPARSPATQRESMATDPPDRGDY
jgi:hypothetical protein